MGPRLDSRGRSMRGRASKAALALQWGRGWTAAEGAKDCLVVVTDGGFNGAAAGQPRKGFVGAGARACPARFNGAAAGQPRKGGAATLRAETLLGFNGAAAGQPRKARARARRPLRAERFNGAAAGQPRKARGGGCL